MTYDDVKKEEIIEKLCISVNKHIRNCIENNIDDSGVRGFQADTQNNKYQFVFQMKINAEDGWWEHFNIEESGDVL